MDVHIRRSITLGLRKSGVDVITAQEERAAELTNFDWSGSQDLTLMAEVLSDEDLRNRVEFLPL